MFGYFADRLLKDRGVIFDFLRWYNLLVLTTEASTGKLANMDIPSVWLELEKFNFKEKKIVSSLKKCIKKLSFKSPSDLGNLSALAHWLYVYGYDDQALLTCQIINEVEFTGNFDLWTPVESLLLLEARISREQSDGEAAKSIIAKVLQPMLPYDDAFRRRLSFDWLSDKSIASYLAKNNIKTANMIRFADIASLIFMRELGIGESDIDGVFVDIVKVEERIIEYRKILKQT